MLLQQCLLLRQLLVLGLLLLQRDLLAFGYELDLIRNQILQNDLRLLSRVTLFAPVLGLWLGMLSMPFFWPFSFPELQPLASDKLVYFKIPNCSYHCVCALTFFGPHCLPLARRQGQVEVARQHGDRSHVNTAFRIATASNSSSDTKTSRLKMLHRNSRMIKAT